MADDNENRYSLAIKIRLKFRFETNKMTIPAFRDKTLRLCFKRKSKYAGERFILNTTCLFYVGRRFGGGFHEDQAVFARKCLSFLFLDFSASLEVTDENKRWFRMRSILGLSRDLTFCFRSA